MVSVSEPQTISTIIVALQEQPKRRLKLYITELLHLTPILTYNLSAISTINIYTVNIYTAITPSVLHFSALVG